MPGIVGPGPGEPGYGDAKEVVSATAKRIIEKYQARIKDNRCVYCGMKAKVKVVEQEVLLQPNNILKITQTTTFKRETWIKCKKCKSYTLNFGPDTKLTTGTKLEEDGII